MTNTFLELSTLAQWCEHRGQLFAASQAASGQGSYTNGNDFVPTCDGIVIAGAKFYVPAGLGLTGKTVRVSLWDTIAPGAKLACVDFVVPAEGRIYSVMFPTPYACQAYRNVILTLHDLDPTSPVWWLMTNPMVQAAIPGTQPYVTPGSLTQVMISNSGLWRCGPYFIAGDANPFFGTYAESAGQISTIDPLV